MTATPRTEEPDISAEIMAVARKVIPTMAGHGIPMSPENYWVWFEHLVGSHEPLSQEISRLVEMGTAFTQQLNRRLFDQFFGEATGKRFVEEFSRETYRILKASLEKVISTGTVTQEYSAHLGDFLGRLEEDSDDPTRLRSLVEDIILETRRMEQSSVELRQQLETAEREAEALRARLQKVEREATRDVLTGLYNRKFLMEKLAAVHLDFRAEGKPYAVIMMDLDLFKKINDTHGHKIGDAVLEFIGGTIRGAVKGRDIPARYGGEEFAILLPRTTLENACRLAEGIRVEIAARKVRVTKTQQEIGRITVSAGVAQASAEDDAGCVLERADRALYLAKNDGRNNVKSERDLPPEGEPTASSE